MGYYISPEHMSKEHFLANHGKLLRIRKEDLQDRGSCEKILRDLKDQNKVLVAHALNPTFTCAAVAVDPAEARRFSRPEDGRPVNFYAVDREALTPDVLGGCNIDEIMRSEGDW